jgi:hypothetical protein
VADFIADRHLDTVMAAARLLPLEKRDLFLQRIAAALTLRGCDRFNDADVAEVVQLALRGLIQQPSSVA